MEFKIEAFDDQQRKNTAQVIKDAKADVLCLIEVEDMKTMQQFNGDLLNGNYKQYILIDSPNDQRGIDVACLSKFPIINIKTHIFDTFEKVQFSRDCLEVSLDIGANGPLHVLCNHFKSQIGGQPSADKRKKQATRVVEILQTTYDLKTNLVAVMGDLNEDSSNAYKSLDPLFACPDLVPIVDPALPMTERYTQYWEDGKKGERLTQLDYIFVSKTLHQKLKKFGFVREGIFDIEKAATDAGAAPVKPYDTVSAWNLSASDHAALWAQFEV
jgi:endonuclease/exonuclease/phosphatase family metal-dependent hydrolase